MAQPTGMSVLLKITNQRVFISTDTDRVSNIQSVTLSRPARSTRPLWLLPPGILLASRAAVTDGEFIEFFNIGIVLGIAGILIFVVVKPTYAIYFETNSGGISIMNTMDTPLTNRIVAAINTAISGKKQIKPIHK